MISGVVLGKSTVETVFGLLPTALITELLLSVVSVLAALNVAPTAVGVTVVGLSIPPVTVVVCRGAYTEVAAVEMLGVIMGMLVVALSDLTVVTSMAWVGPSPLVVTEEITALE